MPYNSCRASLTNRMKFISCHIMSLVINSLGQTHTHTWTRILMICTGSLLRNQVHASCSRPEHPWFKKQYKLYCQWKKVHWLMYLLIHFCQVSYMWVNNNGPIVMYEPYKSGDISCKTPSVLKRCSQVKYNQTCN